MQYGQELSWRHEIGRLANVAPAIFLLSFLVARPPSRAVVPHQLLQLLLSILCVCTGVFMIHLTSKSRFATPHFRHSG